jgi:hypothetical protein
MELQLHEKKDLTAFKPSLCNAVYVLRKTNNMRRIIDTVSALLVLVVCILFTRK